VTCAEVTAGLERVLQPLCARQQQQPKVHAEVRQIHIKEGKKILAFIYKTRVKAGEELWHLPRMRRTNKLLKQDRPQSYMSGDAARERSATSRRSKYKV